jgi:hypothetical protein
MAAAIFVGLLSLVPHLLPHVARPVARRGRACLPAASASAEKDGEAATTDQLLALIAGTDRGLTASTAERAEINRLIGQLEASFDGVDALAPNLSGQLLRNAEVVYVGQSSSKQANAAGGKYRGRVGRLLFQTDALFQHVLEGSARCPSGAAEPKRALLAGPAEHARCPSLPSVSASGRAGWSACASQPLLRRTPSTMHLGRRPIPARAGLIVFLFAPGSGWPSGWIQSGGVWKDTRADVCFVESDRA